MYPSTIVIIGAGQAGGWAAQTLRREGFGGRVTLIGDEPFPPYERPPLSKAVLSGEAPIESTYLLEQAAFDQLNVDWRGGVRANSIDRDRREIVLSTGDRLSYDRLILCSGGRARPMPVPGAQLPGILSLRNIRDAQALSAALVAGDRLVVVGGGWIGLEVAATARNKGMSVSLVEAASRLCERTVPAEISSYLLRLHRSHGVDVILEAGVAGFAQPSSGKLAVQLTDGRALACDAVVVGIGLIPNDELARDAGLECDGGVVVDNQCRTSDPHILAAGDVATWRSSWAGRRMRLESWQNAQEQGIAAARSALGHDVVHQPLPWFWSDQYGANLQIYGMPAATDQVVVRGSLESDNFVVFYLDGETVRAALGPNSAKDLRFARRLIETRKPADPTRLADLSIPMSRV